jgi:hypothetical protein
MLQLLGISGPIGLSLRRGHRHFEALQPVCDNDLARKARPGVWFGHKFKDFGLHLVRRHQTIDPLGADMNMASSANHGPAAIGIDPLNAGSFGRGHQRYSALCVNFPPVTRRCVKYRQNHYSLQIII